MDCFYTIMWNWYILACTWTMSQLIYNLANLVIYIFFVAHITVLCINCHEVLLYAWVCIAHVEASCFESLCRSIIYFVLLFPMFGHFFKSLCGIIDPCLIIGLVKLVNIFMAHVWPFLWILVKYWTSMVFFIMSWNCYILALMWPISWLVFNLVKCSLDHGFF